MAAESDDPAGARTVAKAYKGARSLYKKGKKLFRPAECPWCSKRMPQSQLDEHVLIHQKAHRRCEDENMVYRAAKEGARRALEEHDARAKDRAARSEVRKDKGSRANNRHNK